jgi:hypothetical protein
MYIADISVYQGNIDWDKARQELDMVIFRSSVGDKIDTKYVNNAKNVAFHLEFIIILKPAQKKKRKKRRHFFIRLRHKMD